MKLNEVKYDYKSKQYLAESWDVLTEAQQVYIGSWEKKVWPLVESYSKLLETEITADQVNDIFQKAEKVAMDSGNNTTVLGKAGKVSAKIAGKLKDEIEVLAKKALDSGPIQNVDTAFDKLRSQISTSVGKGPGGNAILRIVDKWKNYAKENPAKAAFALSAMTSALAFASGGIVSGLAIGFFLKLANNILTGEKLSSAVVKTGKQMAIGAIAGGLGKVVADAAADLFPAEVTQIFTSSDGTILDVDELPGMDKTIETITADEVKELMQTRNAFLTMARNLSVTDPDANEAILKQVQEINNKIFELEPDGANANEAVNNLANRFGIEGEGVNLEKTTTTSTGDADSDTYTTEPAGEISNDQIQKAGLDYAQQPDLSEEFMDFLKEKGMTEDEIAQIQAQAGFDKAVADQSWLGVKVSAENSSNIFDGKLPNNIDANEVASQIDIPDNMEVGETFSSEISTSFDGIEGNLTFQGDYSFEGVDADGNDVYQIKSIRIAPESKIADGVLEKLSDEDQDKFWELMGKYTGENIDSSEAAVTEYYDDLNQKLATSFAGAIATVALAGAVANAENKQAENLKQESYRQSVENKLMEQYLAELNALDMMKKAAMATVKGVGKVADATLGSVSAGAMKAAQAAVNTGKAVGKELGNKITVKKLLNLWKSAGKPLTVAGVVQVLQKAGMNDETIGLVNKQVPDLDFTAKEEPKKDGEREKEKVTPGTEQEPQGDLFGKDAQGGTTVNIDMAQLAAILKNNDLDDEVRAILKRGVKAA